MASACIESILECSDFRTANFQNGDMKFIGQRKFILPKTFGGTAISQETPLLAETLFMITKHLNIFSGIAFLCLLKYYKSYSKMESKLLLYCEEIHQGVYLRDDFKFPVISPLNFSLKMIHF